MSLSYGLPVSQRSAAACEAKKNLSLRLSLRADSLCKQALTLSVALKERSAHVITTGMNSRVEMKLLLMMETSLPAGLTLNHEKATGIAAEDNPVGSTAARWAPTAESNCGPPVAEEVDTRQ